MRLQKTANNQISYNLILQFDAEVGCVFLSPLRSGFAAALNFSGQEILAMEWIVRKSKVSYEFNERSSSLLNSLQTLLCEGSPQRVY